MSFNIMAKKQVVVFLSETLPKGETSKHPYIVRLSGTLLEGDSLLK